MTQNRDQRPELIDDRTIELMTLAARMLVLVIYSVVLVTFSILTLGFFLHLVGASSEASFVEWVFRNTERAMQPFRGMFPIEQLDDRSTFDPSLLFAAAFYGFFAIGLHALVNYLTHLARVGLIGWRSSGPDDHEAFRPGPAEHRRPTTTRPVADTSDDDTKELLLEDLDRAARTPVSADS